MTIERGSQVKKALTQLRIVEHTRREAPVEILEQVKGYPDTDCDAYMMRRASCYAGKSGNCEGFKEEIWQKGKFSEWAYAGLKEAYDKVASEDVGRLSIAQDILRKSTDSLRRIVAPVDRMGGVTLSYVCPYCHCFPLEDYIWWVSSGHGLRGVGPRRD